MSYFSDHKWVRYYKYLKEKNRSSAPSIPARSFPICPKLNLPTVPFLTWLSIARSIYTFRGSSPRRLELLYLDYASELREMGFEPQGEWILERIQKDLDKRRRSIV